MDRYRMVLAVDGVAADLDAMPVQGERKSKQHKKRKGFSREESENILASGGKLSRAELLRCRVRHFSDGVVLGGKEFVNAFYTNLKNKAQAREDYQGQYEKRETGARKIRAMNKEDALYSMRDLK
jgi:putative transposase